MGIVFHIERTSLYDGPGVRTVVFLKGCPLHCAWCHNPEGSSPLPQIMFNKDRCIGCFCCVSACPNSARTVHGFDRERCTACGACCESCYTGAMTVVGQNMTPQQVMEVLCKDADLFSASGGGLTISGGEPLFQADFAIALAKMAHDAGIHVCVETSGYGNACKLQELAQYTDLFLYDCKLTDHDAFRVYCGGDLEVVLQNLSLLDRLGAQIILRCPIIPEVNDTAAHMEGIAAWVREYSCIREIQFQPYHRLGLSKAAQLGQVPAMERQAPDGAFVAALAKRLQDLCKKTVTVN